MLPPAPSGRLTDCRVLVVEDVYFIADDVVTALRGAGAMVVGPVPDMRAALELLAFERIDAAVLDINLHGESAYAVADALMKKDIPFVFASGYGQASIPERYRHVALWEKPFDSRAMIRSLPALIAQGCPRA